MIDAQPLIMAILNAFAIESTVYGSYYRRRGVPSALPTP